MQLKQGKFLSLHKIPLLPHDVFHIPLMYLNFQRCSSSYSVWTKTGKVPNLKQNTFFSARCISQCFGDHQLPKEFLILFWMQLKQEKFLTYTRHLFFRRLYITFLWCNSTSQNILHLILDATKTGKVPKFTQNTSSFTWYISHSFDVPQLPKLFFILFCMQLKRESS